MALAGSLALFVGLTGVTVNANIFNETSTNEQLREEVIQHKVELENLVNNLLAQADSDLDNHSHSGELLRKDLLNWSNDSIEKNKNEINNYNEIYLAEIEKTKGKLIEKGSFNTYQQEKNEEIEERITETLEDILK